MSESRVNGRSASWRLRVRGQPAVAIHVARREPLDLREQPRLVTHVVERAAVVEQDPVERIHRHQLVVVARVATDSLEQLRDQVRRRDHRRTRVEAEAVLPEHARATARLVERLEHTHIIALRAQPHGRGETAETAPDHHRPAHELLALP
jgi:hypothetical protein